MNSDTITLNMAVSKIHFKIAAKLLDQRLKIGLTQVEVAKKAGMHSNSYAKIERGDRGATVDTLEKIVKALDIKSSDILPF
jgi:transcriptional regulator with XRE-family HTH domain